MRFRLLGSFSVALLVALCVLAAAAAWVTALERDAAPETTATGSASPPDPVSEPVDCDVLRHEIHALSHEVSRCALVPECRGQPLRCPITRDPRIEREYTRLRDALHAHCGLPRSLVDFAWTVGEQIDLDEDCAVVHDGYEAMVRGESRPTSYSF